MHYYESLREIIRSCLHIMAEHGDTYVARYQDSDTDCVVILSLIHPSPVLSILAADRIPFGNDQASALYKAVNELNAESLTGWHSIMITSPKMSYLYRQCIWINEELSRDEFLRLFHNCISEFRLGRAHLAAAIPNNETT